MKRLLVLLLCAVLAVPAVGMNVQATEPQVPIGDTNVPNTVSENEKEKSAEQSADQVAMANASVLNDYLKNKKFTDAEMKKADEVMKKAAEALGLSYDETNHKLSDGPTGTI